MLKLTDVFLDYGAQSVLRGVSVGAEPGKLTVILGPNGGGKTTLLRVASGIARPSRGAASVRGVEVGELEGNARARAIAVVSQHDDTLDGFSVRDVVMMGRAPHQTRWMLPSASDVRVVQACLERCELASVADRPARTLSGGERRRVSLARAIAQQTPVLLLDELDAHLDQRHSMRLTNMVRCIAVEDAVTCVAVLHDLNVAARFADHVVLLSEGTVAAQGTVEEVMTYRRLREVFGIDFYVGVNEIDQSRYFVPMTA